MFVDKVLKKLYASASREQDKRTQETSSEKPPEKAAPVNVTSRNAPLQTGRTTAGVNNQVPPGKRLYTVSLPPEGYVPEFVEPPRDPGSQSSSNNESSESSNGTEDKNTDDQPKRRRIRKHKSKKKLKNPSNAHAEQAELEKQQTPLQEKSQPPHTDGSIMSKNKRRKLKKKQQLKRKKAAGLLTKTASGVNFLYEPEEGGSEQGDADGEEEEGVTEPEEEEPSGTQETASQEEQETDPEEGPAGTQDRGDYSIKDKADSILSFLKSTQEMYFYDGASKTSDIAVLMETTEELFKHLETHGMSPSDVFILDHMKTLLLLQDTERLQKALQMFPEHCEMPPDHARVISEFFSYWITHVLPEKDSE